MLMPCPCGQDIYLKCCGQYLEQGKVALTPEALMRSRYSAFATNNKAYLQQTLAGLAYIKYGDKDLDATIKWQKLEVLEVSPVIANKAWVTFKAYFLAKNKLKYIYEKSEFHLIDGKWYYVDGEHFK